MNSISLTSPILVIAYKELRDSLRNRWILFMGSIFMLLSLSVTFAGSAVTGELALPPLANLMSSLSTTSVFIIPLAAILLSYDSFVGEQEAGTLLLLLSYPISRSQILIGKLLGHSVVMLITTSCAFGSTAVLLLVFGSQYSVVEVVSVFGQFIISSNLLALIFILLGYIVSLRATEKAKAVAGLLFVWFILVLIYDLLLLTVLVSDVVFMDKQVLNILIALNPTDLYRAINLVSVDADSTGTAFAMIGEIDWGMSVMYSLMLAWICALVVISQRIFSRKPL
ncbi:copper ABC transporter permease [Shewanella sp. GutCb]|jgi:Cu-processing system permease protein|uniref:ABC transporter permease n=1 Tax=Shewanella sp. GutCb TaxID=2058315 RepID=UPI000C7D00E7|nr:ABC transporter permease subunit [Shewanella sp. GutCb]PKG74392.1 copper ABC transporter permease [Shewanella sp. GutCb]